MMATDEVGLERVLQRADKQNPQRLDRNDFRATCGTTEVVRLTNHRRFHRDSQAFPLPGFCDGGDYF